MPKTKQKLTPKQQAFVREYSVDHNGTQAAIRAGYSQKSAEKIARDLLRKTTVKNALAAKAEKLEQKCELKVETLVKEIYSAWKTCATRIAKTDIEGSQEIDADGKPAYRLIDAAAAGKFSDMLMKHLGGYEKDNKKETDGRLEIFWGGAKNES